jgi:quinoprotein glucose dehydrogenase
MDELNADTGKLVPGFGNEREVNLNDQLRGPASENRVSLTSPAGIYKDILITHGGVGETTPASPGDLRGWDVRSGKLLWTFHTKRPGSIHTASTGGKACKHLWQAGFSFNAARTVMNIRCSW